MRWKAKSEEEVGFYVRRECLTDWASMGNDWQAIKRETN
jgi:hypothetical protein